MADNEAKARQKMAEGRKKLQGGGGFLGKLFGGGGGGGEAADLFIQVNNSPSSSSQGFQNDHEAMDYDEEEEEEEYPQNEIECSHDGCQFIASNLLEFEQHYAQHSFQCSQCGIAFDTAHRLEVHHDERHNPFFEIQANRNPSLLHYRCLHPTCELKFSNTRTRDEHSRVVHFILGESSRRRKLENDYGLSIYMKNMSVNGEGREDEDIWNIDFQEERPKKTAVRRGGK
ncbi:hypothetical protein CAEBREN_30129 [Caenorhabditis brenneri]|uniref:C2H2-type domain-containing protein n=1 Tax=Caenorhabditis brenneri TaxID=135651 RepID=G0PFN6_CAEBE|nr:hypothetical protein CAEBREN_30129 [Caenorhabditis brenneri]